VISNNTRKRVERTWRAFCRAVVAAEGEHGAPLLAYFGETQTICDHARLEDHHEGRLPVGGGRDHEDGGACLIYLPRVPGFSQDGGGW